MNNYPNLQTALVSGAPYDWRASCRPERPYRHDYSQTLTLKLFLAQPTPDHTSSDVLMTFSQALENIRLMDQLTWGVPKIVYLVGWQYLGHDSQYPAWHQVNDALKRPCDDTALDSLLWLMREARHYHTVVSVHINMFDAYPNSPLWQTYLDNGLLVTEADGTLQKAGIWNGMQAYCVSYPREWDSGFAQKRIDEICSLLPLQEAGTVHLDAFNCREDPGHGLTLADSQAARRKIVRYWRNLGIDVTSEYLYSDWDLEADVQVDQLVGLQPMAYQLSQTMEDYLDRPASLICGGCPHKRNKFGDTREIAPLFGAAMLPETLFRGGAGLPPPLREEFIRDFCQKQLRFFYLNSLERLEVSVTKGEVTARFSSGVTTRLRQGTMYRNGACMQDASGCCIPAAWCDAIILYTEVGGLVKYNLSQLLDCPSNTTFRADFLDGRETIFTLDQGHLQLNLPPKTMIRLHACES